MSSYVTFNYRPAGAKFVNPFKLGTSGSGTDTSPFNSIREAITALGTAGGTIVIGGGGLIQEDCTKLASGVTRTTGNSGNIHFYFDSGFAISDASLPEYFRVTNGDSVSNFFWANGNFLANPFGLRGVGGTYTNCIFDACVIAGLLNNTVNAIRCAFSRCAMFTGIYPTVVNYSRCIIYKPTTTPPAIHMIMSSCYISKRNNGTGGITCTSLGDCTCETGAVSSLTNFVQVGDPMFVNVATCNFGILEGSPLQGLGQPDSARGNRTDCGLGGRVKKIRSDEGIWSPANGAIYDGVVQDGEGGFKLAPGYYYGTVESADQIFDKYTVIGFIQLPIATTYVDNLPQTSSDIARVCHNSSASATASVNTEIVLSTKASSIDGIYVGMELEILSGAGTPGVYEVSAYNGATKVATLLTNTGAPTDITTAYRIRDKYIIRYDAELKFAQRGEDLTSVPWARYETNVEASYTSIGGLLYGNADPGYVYDARRTVGGYGFKHRIALNALNYGV